MIFSSALVTGANGFIGRALVRELHRAGRDVIAMTRRTAALPSGVRQVVADLTDPSSVAAALRGQRFDVVFHLAAYGVSPADRDTAMMSAVNVDGTGALVCTAADAGAKAVVFAGSCSEYAPAEHGVRIDESHELTKDNVYGASKVAGGYWGRALAHRRAVAFCWMRLFGVYGPGEADHRLIPYLVTRLSNNEAVDLTPGRQVRDLMFIDDAVRGLILAADAALVGHGGPFNLCSGQGTEIGEIARLIASLLGKPAGLLAFGARAYRPDEPLWLVGDPESFHRVSSFTPKVDVPTGIRATLASI